jgi:hypothetical protein
MPDMLDADHHLTEFMNKEYVGQNVFEKILDHRGQPNAYEYLVKYEPLETLELSDESDDEHNEQTVWIKQEQMTSATKSIAKYWNKQKPIEVPN